MNTVISTELMSRLARLMLDEQVASLGTFQAGYPLVTMTQFVVLDEYSQIAIHVSGLAQHTQAMRANNKVGLMVCESVAGARNPQTLDRLSITGVTNEVDPDTDDHQGIKRRYLEKYPKSAISFTLPDFTFFKIHAVRARLITGFGEIVDLTPEDLDNTSRLEVKG